MLELTTDRFNWNSKTRTFSEELSSIEEIVNEIPREILLKNPKTGGDRFFFLIGRDTLKGDIHGWRFSSHDGIKILLIND